MGLRAIKRGLKLRFGSAVSYHGLLIPKSRSGMTYVIAELMMVSGYERAEIEAVEALLQLNDRVLELGTGLGVVSAIAARRAAGGQILTFEANPYLIPDTKGFFDSMGIRNIVLENAVLLPGGPEEIPEQVMLHHAKSFAESSIIDGELATGKSSAVKTRPLSEVVSSFRPDVLICDIEGAEAELIPALDASGLRAAVIELHPHRLTRQEVAAIYDHLARHGLYPMIEHSSGTVVAFERVT